MFSGCRPIGLAQSPVSLTAHWPMKAVLYSLFQSTPHTIKEEPFILPFHRPHTHNFPLFLSLRPLIRLSSSLFLQLHSQFVSPSPKMPLDDKREQIKTSRFSKCGDKPNLILLFSSLHTKLQLQTSISVLDRCSVPKGPESCRALTLLFLLNTKVNATLTGG